MNELEVNESPASSVTCVVLQHKGNLMFRHLVVGSGTVNKRQGVRGRVPKRQEPLQPEPKHHIDWTSLHDHQPSHRHPEQWKPVTTSWSNNVLAGCDNLPKLIMASVMDPRRLSDHNSSVQTTEIYIHILLCFTDLHINDRHR